MVARDEMEFFGNVYKMLQKTFDKLYVLKKKLIIFLTVVSDQMQRDGVYSM